jgi:hypothetical protein
MKKKIVVENIFRELPVLQRERITDYAAASFRANNFLGDFIVHCLKILPQTNKLFDILPLKPHWNIKRP